MYSSSPSAVPSSRAESAEGSGPQGLALPGLVPMGESSGNSWNALGDPALGSGLARPPAVGEVGEPADSTAQPC